MVNKEIAEHSSYILVHLASQEDAYDVWLLRFIEELLFNANSTLNDCLHVLLRVMGKYLFETPRKHTIIHRVLIHMRNKLQLNSYSPQQVAELTHILQSSNPLALYHLSTEPEFQELFFSLKNYFKNIK